MSQIHSFSCTPDLLSKTNFASQEAFTLLQKCTTFRQLKQIHAKIIRAGLSHDQLLLRKIINFCSSHDHLEYAALVFHQIPSPLTFTWNLMIRAYTLNASSHQALLLYTFMMSRGFPPDKFTFPFVIKACATCSSFHQGHAIHGQSIKAGFSGDIFVQNTLMDFYFKCGNAHNGRKVFEKMHVRNVVSWTTMVRGLLASGDLHAARAIFEHMPAKNVVSWTIMIDGYVKNRQPEEAFELFRRMQLDNVSPNEFTLVSLLKACTELGSLKLGRWVHDFTLKNGFNLDVFFGTALIDMYSKCGSLEGARRVFDKMQARSLATWNSMITSLGVHGFGEEALALFEEMERTDVQPDAITFVGVLSACLQTNNLHDGRKYFEYMTEGYGISPIWEHYTCIIELYSRAGMLDEVGRLVKAMPVKANDEQLWGSNTNGTASVGELDFRKTDDLDCLVARKCYNSDQLGWRRVFKWDGG
ncbi:hypothetical protein TIFTF001_026459 [Ficus carica]|uniref:Pentatricopeptide repeat-containing protein n=1 Tax=Ficus carica TaxID=3494 RepID=A0AA88IYR7_FICCA|nr:hypothetical protein TIFTF001_026459 [Ficus carica]